MAADPQIRQRIDGPDGSTAYPISFGPFHAEVVSTGAGLRMLERDLYGKRVALTETWEVGTKPPLSAGLILAPWANRIRDGRFEFDGVDHELEITEPARHNAIHGLVRRQEWTLVQHSESAVVQAIQLGLHKGWPYPMRLVVTHELDSHGLTVTHHVVNTGIVPAPFGLGIHSFVRVGDVPLDECTLQLAAGVWQPIEPERMLPAGPCLPVWNSRYDFTKPKSLAGVWLDTPFGSVLADDDGKARHILRAPDGTGTVLWTDKSFGWVQVFTADPANDQPYPGRGRALAIEPMTAPPDAFNTGIDELVLEPEKVWTAQWGISVL